MTDQKDKELDVVVGELVPAAANDAAVVDALAWLDPGERHALGYFQEHLRAGGAETYPLAPSVSSGMLALFLQGRTLAEIRALNHPKFGMGQIVHAAVEGDWAGQREIYAQGAVARARTRAVLAAAEGIELTADLMVAVRKLHGDGIARFLQTGDPQLLGSALSPTTLRQLKDLTELLTKLTGQEGSKKVSGTIKHEHTGTVTTVPTAAPAPFPAGAASAVLAALAAQERERLEADLGKR